MKFVVFGATGGCGRLAIREGIRRGHHMIAAIRPGSASTSPELRGAEIRECDAYDADAATVVDEDTDAVLSCIGIRRRHPINPWSRLTSPSDTAHRCTMNIIDAMRRRGVRRLACVSAAGVGQSRLRCSPMVRCLIRCTNLAPAYRDLERMENELARSGLAWLALRPTTLTNAALTSPPRITDRYSAASRISRIAVANLLLDFAEGHPHAPIEVAMVTQ